jgi:hypothetical protein
VQAARSVLLIDAVDTYGSDFASFTPAALEDVAARERCASQESAGGSSSAPTREAHEHTLPSPVPFAGDLPPGSRLLRLKQKELPVSAVSVLPEVGGLPAGVGSSAPARRGIILDLAPKLVYQAEPLVDLLVKCRCHHYLEFKAVEGRQGARPFGELATAFTRTAAPTLPSSPLTCRLPIPTPPTATSWMVRSQRLSVCPRAAERCSAIGGWASPTNGCSCASLATSWPREPARPTASK